MTTTHLTIQASTTPVATVPRSGVFRKRHVILFPAMFVLFLLGPFATLQLDGNSALFVGWIVNGVSWYVGAKAIKTVVKHFP